MDGHNKQQMTPQVDSRQYFSAEYLTPERFASYAYQLSMILRLKPQSILEIGPGNGVVTFLLRKAGINVTTLDFDLALEPDIVASVTEMPFPDNSFDAVICFQVLEHLTYDDFKKGLREIFRTTRRLVVMSVPDIGRYAKLEVHLPSLGTKRRLAEIPLFRASHRFCGQHYWVVNSREHSLREVVRTIEAVGYTVSDTFRVWEYPYHRYFVLTKHQSELR